MKINDVEKTVQNLCNNRIQLILTKHDSLNLPDFEKGFVDFLIPVRDGDIGLTIAELQNEKEVKEFANPKGNEAYFQGYSSATQEVINLVNIVHEIKEMS